MRKHIMSGVAALLLLTTALQARAEYPLEYGGEVRVGTGTGDFAPYYISALDHGRTTSQHSATAEVWLKRGMDLDRRFSYGFAADIMGGYNSAVDYERYDRSTGTWYTHGVKPAAAWIQQLYGEIKYRQVFLEAGMKERGSGLLNQRLTSGDLIESGNVRPIPQVRAGFIDFVDIPLTNGWVQIQGEVAYGKFADSGWITDQYNYYNYHITEGEYYNYKRCYFRTKPSMPFSLTIGMQAAAEFGGYERFYSNGVMTQEDTYPTNLKTWFKMLFPGEDGGEGGYYTGNHLGSWDIQGRYRLPGGHEIKAYVQWPWEDGSGIGKLNGFDGLWGLEYKAPEQGWVTGAVIEYLDLTNQSGPIHYWDGDYEGTNMHGHATGMDDYYNNRFHRAYANYGLSIGSPMVMAPFYNLDGYPDYKSNLMRGVHAGIEGRIIPGLCYRIKGGWRTTRGNGQFILPKAQSLTAVMVEADWKPASVRGLSVNAKIEIDRGTLPCNAFGALVSVRYDGIFSLGKSGK